MLTSLLKTLADKYGSTVPKMTRKYGHLPHRARDRRPARSLRSDHLDLIKHPSTGFDELIPKTLATATVDRLLHHAHVLITDGTDGYRLAQATANKGVRPVP
jgi:hypothetical protein